MKTAKTNERDFPCKNIIFHYKFYCTTNSLQIFPLMEERHVVLEWLMPLLRTTPMTATLGNKRLSIVTYPVSWKLYESGLVLYDFCFNEHWEKNILKEDWNSVKD